MDVTSKYGGMYVSWNIILCLYEQRLYRKLGFLQRISSRKEPEIWSYLLTQYFNLPFENDLLKVNKNESEASRTYPRWLSLIYLLPNMNSYQ